MKIETLLDAASEANIIHFPQGLHIERGDGRWCVTVIGKDGPGSPHAHGETPEEAIENLRKSIVGKLTGEMNMAEREVERKAETIKTLEGT